MAKKDCTEIGLAEKPKPAAGKEIDERINLRNIAFDSKEVYGTGYGGIVPISDSGGI